MLGSSSPLFALKEGTSWADFDVSFDGKEFLEILPEVQTDAQPLTVVLKRTAEIGH